jgi:hypothetical protein
VTSRQQKQERKKKQKKKGAKCVDVATVGDRTDVEARLLRRDRRLLRSRELPRADRRGFEPLAARTYVKFPLDYATAPRLML